MYYNEKRKAITAKYVKTHLDDIKIEPCPSYMLYQVLISATIKKT